MQYINLTRSDGKLSEAEIKEFADRILQEYGNSYIVGPAKSGKTEAAVRCMVRLARKRKVLFISTEESCSSILHKMYLYCFSFKKNTDNLMFEIASPIDRNPATLFAVICSSDAEIVIIDGVKYDAFEDLSCYHPLLDRQNQNVLRVIYSVCAPRYWEYATFQNPHPPIGLAGYVE